MKNIDLLLEGFKELNIDATAQMVKQFELYYDLLIEWNSKINLTSITEENEVIVKHFLDSLLIIKAFDLKGVKRVLDLGTGAGFPGIPLKIIYPHINLVLLDSVNKKITYLQEVSKQLELTNVNYLHGRAEDYAKMEAYREGFDLVVSRAVSNLSTLSEYCLPFTNMKGSFVAYKSGDCDLEIEDAQFAISTLGGSIKRTETFKIPSTDIMRTYVCIGKVKHTPNRYPRKAGLPAKNPL